MGYQMPMSWKTINLPVPSTSMTLKEYQEKYGIDLNAIFTIKEFIETSGDSTEFALRDKNAKYYLLSEYGDGVYLSAPLITLYGETNVINFTIAYKGGAYNYGLQFNYVDINNIKVSNIEI